MKERGSALLTAVIMVMVLLAISGIFFTTIIYQAKNESSEEKGLRAYYLAEAGLQYGIAAGKRAVADGTLAVGGTLALPSVTLPGQSGHFEVSITNGTTSFTVTSTGDYFDDRRVKQGEYGYGGGGGTDCKDEGPLPDYPLWDTHTVYGNANTHVTYIDSDGNKRAFYNIWYADSRNVPGEGTDGPWKEITIKWRNFNRYTLGGVSIACYQGKKYKVTTSSYSNNQLPGVPGNPWQEITNEWRNFNVYHGGDIVDYGGNSYKAWYDIYNFKEPGVDGNPWQKLTNAWQNFNDYNGGDIVEYGGELYRARDNGADSQQPGLMNSKWQKLTSVWQDFNIYDPGNSNVYNDVMYNGQKYRASYYSQNIIPGTSNAWQLIPNSTITPPVLLGVMVTPATASITVGQTQIYTAKAIYSDGSTKDVTTSATWSSYNSSYATTNTNVVKGIASGVVNGTILESTPASFPIGISIPINANYGGKVGTGYITVNPTTSNSGSDTNGTNGVGLLWEKEIISNS